MAAAPRLMTAEEYFRTPETLLPAELAFGVLRVGDAPTPRHQSMVANLFRALDAHVRERRLGRVWLSPLDVVLDEARALIVQPELLFISNDRAWIVGDRVRGAPDLVIEVLSPSNSAVEMEERVALYLEAGVRAVWIFNPKRRTVTTHGPDGVAHTLRADETLDGGDILPGFRMVVGEAFGAEGGR